MPLTKTEGFVQKDVRLARWAKAFSHPARVAILRTLAKRNACLCGEIVEVLPLAQATVSQHLKELKLAGLISGTVEGPASCYCIDKDAVGRLKTEYDSLFSELLSGCTTAACSTAKEKQ